jgi:hypothetical protein
MTEWSIFLCYRQIDGSDTAQWLHELLNGTEVGITGVADHEEVTLDVYFDAATPAVSDWHHIHRPALERARAFFVVCTPGLFAKLSADDWVHMEIEWWLRHRKAAPIIVDTTGEGERWVPETIRSRWPNAQRVLVELPVWRTLPEAERKAKQEILRERILGGIKASEYGVRYERAVAQTVL